MITLGYPVYNPYRPLSFGSEEHPQEGEDVWALQCGLKGVLGDDDLHVDGILMEETSDAIWNAQEKLAITEDGVAGGQTDKAICMWIVRHTLVVTAAPRAAVRKRLAKGHIQRESSYLLGNYSAQRIDDDADEGWSFDAGATQMNSAHHPLRLAFDPVQSIPIMLESVYKAYLDYADRSKFRGTDHSEKRRWALAAGSWNAPAFANWYAGVKPDLEPEPDQQVTFEEYMREAVVYL